MKLLIIAAVIGGGAYYWYSTHPGSFGAASNTISADVSKAENKANHLR